MYQDEYVAYVGSVGSLGERDDPDAPQTPRATLWLPDPESRSGWGMKHIWRPEPKSQARSPLGYRRSGRQPTGKR